MFCTVSGGTTEPTRVRPKRPWMVGRGVATRQEGWGLARCYCWLQVTRRGMEVLYGLFDAVSCVGELFAKSTKCLEFVRPTWCTLTGVYNLAKDCPRTTDGAHRIGTCANTSGRLVLRDNFVAFDKTLSAGASTCRNF